MAANIVLAAVSGAGRRCSAFDAAGAHETVVMTHEQLAFDLLQGIENYAYHNQQRGAAKEGGKVAVDVHRSGDAGHNAHDGKEKRARQGDTVHYRADVIGGGFTGFYAGDETVVLFHFIRHLRGVEDERRIEEGEHDHEYCIDQVVPGIGMIAEDADEGGSVRALRSEAYCGGRDKHDGLGEDDGHYTGCIHLEGNELAHPAVLFIANDAFCIVHGYLARALYQQDEADGDQDEECQLHEEEEKAAAGAGRFQGEFLQQGFGKAGKDADHDDDGSTVTDPFIRHFLTQPHYEQGARGEHYRCGEPEHEGAVFRYQRRAGLRSEVSDIGAGLESSNDHGEEAGILVDFFAAAVTFLLQFLEIGNRDGEQLDGDGCRDVRHDAQREDGSTRKRTSGEHVEQTENALLRRFGKAGECVRIETRKGDIGAYTVHQCQKQRGDDAFAQVLDAPDVLYGFDKFLHRKIRV